MELRELKLRVRTQEIHLPAGERYARFLDSMLDPDMRGKNKDWDLWYISNNTDFCKGVVENRVNALESSLLPSDTPRAYPVFSTYERGIPGYLRYAFGTLCVFASAALDSFAHEVNIFYELGVPRRQVYFKHILRSLAPAHSDTRLHSHLSACMEHEAHLQLRDYRNAVAHGFVYPMRLQKAPLGAAVPAVARADEEPFSFSGAWVDLPKVAASIRAFVSHSICKGWKCFEDDALT